jgi:hypothetical protein
LTVAHSSLNLNLKVKITFGSVDTVTVIFPEN